MDPKHAIPKTEGTSEMEIEFYRNNVHVSGVWQSRLNRICVGDTKVDLQSNTQICTDEGRWVTRLFYRFDIVRKRCMFEYMKLTFDSCDFS